MVDDMDHMVLDHLFENTFDIKYAPGPYLKCSLLQE